MKKRRRKLCFFFFFELKLMLSMKNYGGAGVCQRAVGVWRGVSFLAWSVRRVGRKKKVSFHIRRHFFLPSSRLSLTQCGQRACRGTCTHLDNWRHVAWRAARLPDSTRMPPTRPPTPIPTAPPRPHSRHSHLQHRHPSLPQRQKKGLAAKRRPRRPAHHQPRASTAPPRRAAASTWPPWRPGTGAAATRAI